MKDKPKNNDKLYYGILITVAIILVAVVAAVVLLQSSQNPEDEKELAYTDLITQMTEGKIGKIEMTVGSTTVKVYEKDKNGKNKK